MLTDLTSSVLDISSEQLDKLLGDVPPTVTADTLNLGEHKDKDPEITNTNLTGSSDVPVINLEELEKEPVKEGKEGEEAKPKEGEEAKEEKKESASPEFKLDAALLKNSVNYLVEKGILKDFEGREELELDEATFGQLLEQQLEALAEDKYSSKKSATGDYGQAIMDYIENGGDPDELIDIFKEQQQVRQLDISEEDSQRELITQYYKDTLGWRPERIKKHLDFLASDSEAALEEEAKEIKTKYDEHYRQEIATAQKQQAEAQREQVKAQKQFETSIKTALKDHTQDDATRRRLEDSLFKFKKLDDGRTVNDFYIKFAEWQNDPKKYIELTEFITDHDNYLKRKQTAAKNEAVDKSFKFIKGNATVSKQSGSAHQAAPETTQTGGANFSVVFKKK